MEEFKVGEYVRTDKGLIDKVIGFKQDEIVFEKDSMVQYKTFNDIVKHSFNIIDLIELGDFVNGDEIIEIRHCGEKRTPIFNNYFKNSRRKIDLEEKDIKTIVTKEQFESVEYKVGE